MTKYEIREILASAGLSLLATPKRSRRGRARSSRAPDAASPKSPEPTRDDRASA